jgi:hypothetical protein
MCVLRDSESTGHGEQRDGDACTDASNGLVELVHFNHHAGNVYLPGATCVVAHIKYRESSINWLRT